MNIFLLLIEFVVLFIYFSWNIWNLLVVYLWFKHEFLFFLQKKGMNFYAKYSKLVVDLCGQEMIKNLVLLSILLLWKLLNFSKIYVIEIKILCD